MNSFWVYKTKSAEGWLLKIKGWQKERKVMMIAYSDEDDSSLECEEGSKSIICVAINISKVSEFLIN